MLKRLGYFGVLIACLAALAPAGASAATVTNTNDSGPGSLRAEVEEAAAGETISLPAGSYQLTSGEIVIEKSLTISGAGAGNTTIRGGNFRTFKIEGTGNSVTLSGLALKGNDVNEGVIEGGVIYVYAASLKLSGVDITGVSLTTAGGVVEGGCIFAAGEGTLTILDSSIDHVSVSVAAESGQAGGVVEGGAIFLSGMKPIVERSSLTDISVDARAGQGPSTSTQSGGVVEGGGLFAGVGTTGGTISSSTIGRISANVSQGPGGHGGIVEGGGLFLVADEGEFTLARDTIAENVSRGSEIAEGGGAFLVAPESATISVLASTIASNQGEMGGGVFAVDGVRFADSILAGNSGAPGEQNCDLEGASEPVSGGFNLDSSDECGFHAAGDRVNANPQLGPLQGNGGPTQTMLPAASSPAVDQGSAPGSAADQRGAPRPIDFPSIANAPGGDGSDIGAVEVQASNAFSFGAVTRNKKKGTATLAINLPAPPNAGTLTLSSPGLKSQTLALTGSATSVSFPLVATGGALKALKKKGKRAVAITVSLQPPGTTASTQSLTTKLFKKLKKKHHKHRRHKKNAKHGARNKKHHR